VLFVVHALDGQNGLETRAKITARTEPIWMPLSAKDYRLFRQGRWSPMMAKRQSEVCLCSRLWIVVRSSPFSVLILTN
jgi:hypothetical protein